MAWSERTYQEVRELIRQEKPDIAHVHNIFVVISPSVYYALDEAGIPVVQTLHNYRLICPNATLYRNGKICEKCIGGGNFMPVIVNRCWRDSFLLSYFLVKTLNRHIKSKTFCEKIHRYITLSEFSRAKFIQAGFQGEKISVKPNFLEIDVQEKEYFGNFALFVGRLVEYKGVNTLISAFARLNKYHLKIIGDGPLRNKIKKMLKFMDNVELLGELPRDKVIEYMKNCRFLIFPSQCYENMPLTIIEAFSCGVPVIASRMGATSEIIKHGITGLLFDPFSVEDLISKIVWAWSNHEKIKEIGKRGRMEYEEKYTEEKNYNILMSIYNSVLH
jgi:glycosyltransferase involved in cell wall biosynthesis